MTTEPIPPRGSRALFVVAALLIVVIWQLPHGEQILYPFSLLATYVHEMGHGLTALMTGGEFKELVMYPDGSGVALWAGSGRLQRAVVAAGGLLGPTIAGAAILVASRRQSWARWVLLFVSFGLALSVPLFVRNLFGVIFVVAAAVAIGGVARLVPRLAPFAAQLLGVVLCLALFRDVDYMFSPGGMIAGQQHSSDSAAIADALFLPYWFWGAIVAATAAIVLALAVRAALRPLEPRLP